MNENRQTEEMVSFAGIKLLWRLSLDPEHYWFGDRGGIEVYPSKYLAR